jgi:hypothetical protein
LKYNTYTEEQIAAFAVKLKRVSETYSAALKVFRKLSEEDFYRISATDVFKVALTDIFDSALLRNLLPDIARERIFGDYNNELENAVYYAFAVRLPYINRTSENLLISDKQLAAIFEACLRSGADGETVIGETLKDNIKSVKSRFPEQPFEGQWLRKFLSASDEVFVPPDNRNMFFFGCVPILSALLYGELGAKLE